MSSDFDIASENYDETFTYSNIGKMQRAIVYDYLNTHVLGKKSLHILEINCGTGEDAKWFANQNHTVLATDISEGMINKAKQKNDLKNLKFQQLDINKIDSCFRRNDNTESVIPAKAGIQNKFDLIFSNFGGLNCLSNQELEAFFKNASSLLNENGKIVCVIMPKNCIWENNYLFLAGKWKQLFRRNTKDYLLVNVEGTSVKTWYYNPKEIVSLTKNEYHIKNYKPIGFFIPPSYLESFFKRNNWLLNSLNWLENQVTNWSFLSRYSDHFIITLQK